MSRTYEESMTELSAVLERYPCSAVSLGRTTTDWMAILTVEVPYAGPNSEANSAWGGSRQLSFDAVSCEAEKVLDSLASKVAEAGL